MAIMSGVLQGCLGQDVEAGSKGRFEDASIIAGSLCVNWAE